MKTLLLILITSFSIPTFAEDSTEAPALKAFASDYCSMWPEGKTEDPSQWADCCFTHDLHYWIGGTEDERKTADKELKSCVKLSGASFESFLMYIGVRIGGNPGEASYAWGFGWSQSRGYEKMPHEDLVTAKTLLENSEYNNNESTRPLIAHFIDEVLSAKLDSFK